MMRLLQDCCDPECCGQEILNSICRIYVAEISAAILQKMKCCFVRVEIAGLVARFWLPPTVSCWSIIRLQDEESRSDTSISKANFEVALNIYYCAVFIIRSLKAALVDLK